MHCNICWELSEDIRELQKKSNQQLCDWSTLLADIPDNISKECEMEIRALIFDILSDIPSERFPFSEWHEFLNGSLCHHGIEFVRLAMGKMEEAAKTPEDKQSYRNIVEGLNSKVHNGRKAIEA